MTDSFSGGLKNLIEIFYPVKASILINYNVYFKSNNAIEPFSRNASRIMATVFRIHNLIFDKLYLEVNISH